MRIVSRGHPAVRATHDKTLELTADATITERATCVLAVSAVLPERPMAGPVRMTLRAADETFAFDARAVSSWQPGPSLVVRRSGVRTPSTFAVEATATSADLPRPLVDALRDPAAEVIVEVARRPSSPTLVVADPRTDPAVLAVEEEAAQEVDGRDLVVTDEPFPRPAHEPGVRVETVGLRPSAAAVAAAPWSGPLTIGTAADLATTPVTHLLLVPTVDPAQLLTQAGSVRGTTRAVLAADGLDPVLHRIGDDVPRLTGTVWCCLCPASESGALDPWVRAAVEALLADGVPTKTVAKALAALTQQPQRAAYDVVLGLRGTRPG